MANQLGNGTMTNDKAFRIASIAADLKSLVKDGAQDQLSIVVETSEDEAMTLGSVDAYINFTAELLEKVADCSNGFGQAVELEGEQVLFSVVRRSIMNGESDVVIRSLGVTNATESE